MHPEKIFLMGGTFNPPHLGHAKVLHAIEKEYKPDLILLIPTAAPPHKELPRASASTEDRFAMLGLGMPALRNMQISDMEVRRGGKSYTNDTLDELLRIYPEAAFYLVVGSDMFLSMETWHAFRQLLGKCTLVTVSRNEEDGEKIADYKQHLEEKYGAKIIILKMEPFVVSSSLIRDVVKNGGDISALVDEEVREYIEKKGLYR